jgi:serine O-acetyltransferase
MFDNLRADIDRWRQEDVTQGWWKRYRWADTIRHLLALGMPPVIVYRFEHWIYKRVRIPVLRQGLQVFGIVLRRFVGMWTGVYIHPRAEIGPGFEVHSFYGVLIGITKIGKNFTVGTGVLVNCGAGGIGDNVYMGPGAKIIGDAKVGNNVVIMPNSVVLTDVPDNTTIAGVPARIKLRGGRPKHQFPELQKKDKTQGKQAVPAASKAPLLRPVEPTDSRGKASDSDAGGDGRKKPAAEELEGQTQR